MIHLTWDRLPGTTKKKVKWLSFLIPPVPIGSQVCPSFAKIPSA